ncbi:MAG TPA: peptidylprolyl isomerase [Terriglobales bacterium]|nr:peptidylprolyl isomerase [Terriglobales bacterium]
MKKSLVLVSLACLALLPAVLTADTVVEEIIARVNNSIITRSDFARSREQLKDEIRQQDPGNADKEFAEKERDVLRDLIDQQLLLEKGKDLGITADTDLIKKLDEMRKQMNLDSMEELEKAAQSQGISYEDFKQNLRNQVITQKVIGQEVGSHLNITKEEEQKFYEEHKSEMEQPEQVRLSEILVAVQKPAPPKPAAEGNAPTDKAATPAEDTPAAGVPAPAGGAASAELEEEKLKAAEAKANGLLEQIKKGGAFDEVARKSSDGPSAAQGGDLGLFKRGTLSKELEDRTFAMKAGEVTDVIRTKQGFVILKVTEHQMAGIPPFKQIEPRIQDALYYQKLQPALRVYLKKLREEAYIDVHSGYVDTGASPNQTKPVETASKEASAKNLKKKKKLGLF